MKRVKRRAPQEQYTKDSYRRAIARAVVQANKKYPKKQGEIPHWHPNQLRHSAVTSVRSQFGLEAAQVILGHANAVVTQVYAERDFNLAERVVAQVG